MGPLSTFTGGQAAAGGRSGRLSKLTRAECAFEEIRPIKRSACCRWP